MAANQLHVYDYLIDEHGRWVCEGNPVVDRELFRLLSCGLFGDGGRYYVRCEGEVHPVRVVDAPLWVRYVHVVEDEAKRLERVALELEDGRRETLRPETLWVVDDRALYCLATRQRLPARFGRVAYYELARYIEADEESGCYHLALNGRRWPIARGKLPC